MPTTQLAATMPVARRRNFIEPLLKYLIDWSYQSLPDSFQALCGTQIILTPATMQPGYIILRQAVPPAIMLICLATSFKLFGGSIEFLAVQAASSSIPATAVPWLGMPHTTREKHNSGKNTFVRISAITKTNGSASAA